MKPVSRFGRLGAVAVFAGAMILLLSEPAHAATASSQAPTTPIEHVIVVMQGDRSFDNYFGTFPGADGPPAKTCQAFILIRPAGGCVKPFEARGRVFPPLAPGPTVLNQAYHGGRMDGFVAAYAAQGRDGTSTMAYYDRRDLPFSWAAAERYVLFDKFFSSALYGTRINRSYWVSAAPPPIKVSAVAGYGTQLTIFDRLQAAGVSWKFYVEGYDPTQTFRAQSASSPIGQTVRVPLLNYPRFVDDPALKSHIVDLKQYSRDLAAGTLPAVAYIASAGAGERSARSIAAGQRLQQNLTTQLMLSRFWAHSALLVTYDGSGGWFDHVAPPTRGNEVLGLRVPTLLISPYAREGHVEHAVLDTTSILKFIEQNWRLSALTARDRAAGSMQNAFDFRSPPRPPVLISSTSPQLGAVVHVDAAYLAYGAASLLALIVLFGALWAPQQFWRRTTWRHGGQDPPDGDPPLPDQPDHPATGTPEPIVTDLREPAVTDLREKTPARLGSGALEVGR